MESDDVIIRQFPLRLRPYMVLLGGVCIMLSLPINYSFANLLPYLVSYLHYRVDESITTGSMIWMQTLLSGVPFSMLVGGVLEESIGPRVAVLFGTILYTGSIALSSVVIDWSYLWLLVSFGALPAFGNGIAYNAVLITAQRWFPTNVGFAGGIIVSGIGCGTFFMAPIQTAFVNPDRYVPNAEGLFPQKDLLDRVPYVFLVMAAFFTVLQTIGIILLAPPSNEPLLDEETPIYDSPNLRLVSRNQLVLSSSFLFLFLTLFFSSAWVQIVTGLYKAYALQFIPSDHFLSMVAAVSSLFNCASRIVWGYLADKISLRQNGIRSILSVACPAQTSYQSTMVISSLLGATVTFCLPFVRYTTNQWLFLSAICLIFVCVGGTYSLLPFVSSRLFGKDHFGVLYGLIQISLSFSGICSGLMGQFLLPLLGYDSLFLLAGLLPVISFIFTALIHLTPLARSCLPSSQELTQDY